MTLAEYSPFPKNTRYIFYVTKSLQAENLTFFWQKQNAPKQAITSEKFICFLAPSQAPYPMGKGTPPYTPLLIYPPSFLYPPIRLDLKGGSDPWATD